MRHTKQTDRREALTITIQLELDLLEERGYYTTTPQTFGQYIRKERIDRGMTARQMAGQIGCTQEILLTWEQDKRIPGIRNLRRILQQIEIPQEYLKTALSNKYSIDKSLLFNPKEIKQKLHNGTGCTGCVLRALRLSRLKTHREMAKELRIDPSTLLDWENERHKPMSGMMERIRGLLIGMD